MSETEINLFVESLTRLIPLIIQGGKVESVHLYEKYKDRTDKSKGYTSWRAKYIVDNNL